ncbi:hypothetical protein LLG95_18600 [bacterium]|nr:hypothetical protein [bacterium]
MKVTLDLKELVESGKITPEEAERLKALSKQGTSKLAYRIVIVLGVLGVALGGILLLVPFFENLLKIPEFRALIEKVAAIIDPVLRFVLGTVYGKAIVSALLLAAAFRAKSGFLAGLSAVVLFMALGSSTWYAHASYWMEVSRPLLTIAVFAAVGALANKWSARLTADRERLLIIYARASLLFVNLAFWVGSLWGDDWLKTLSGGQFGGEIFFSIVWAIALAWMIAFGVRYNRRAMVNMAAVFAGIHFYTQWFEHLHASGGSLFVAGLIALAFAKGLAMYNQALTAKLRAK